MLFIIDLKPRNAFAGKDSIKKTLQRKPMESKAINHTLH
jgi:hypothetical protein